MAQDRPAPPLQEGGWGWVIVASNFLMLIIYFGLIHTLPVFLVEWMAYFDATATDISWVISLNPAIKGILSPFAGLLCTRFTSRHVAMVGAFLFSGSVFLSAFSITVWHLCVTLCILAGIGSALLWTPTLLMLGEYFDERYVFANSIAFLGFGGAQIAMPRFAQFLKDTYGWRGAILILSAVFSHTFVVAALLRPNKSKLSTQTQLDHRYNKTNDNKRTSAHMYDAIPEDPPGQSANTESKDVQSKTSSLDMNSVTQEHQSQGRSGAYTIVRYQPNTNRCARGCNRFRLFASNTRHYLWHTYGISLLATNVFYLAANIGSFLGGVGWFTTSGYLVARATTSGLPEGHSALLLTIIGIGSIFGRISHGIVIDKDIVSRDVMFITAFALTALSSFLNPVLDTFWFLSIIAAMFGVGHGICNSLVFAMMKVTVGSREAPAALSIGTMTQDVANTLGGILAGLLFDVTGDYVVSFVFAGTSILSGDILLFIVFIVYQRYKNNKVK